MRIASCCRWSWRPAVGRASAQTFGPHYLLPLRWLNAITATIGCFSGAVSSASLPITTSRRASVRTSLHRARHCTGGGGSRAAEADTEGKATGGLRRVGACLNCMEWSLLPPATEEMTVQAAVVKGRFMGDPSHEYEHTELQKVNEGDKVFEEEVVVQVKEETRLVSVIDQIDKAVAVIPRGALFKTPFGPVHVNRTFEGLSLSEAKKLSSYFHFREPVELKNKTLHEKADLDPSLDFMDSLEHDIPKGSWSIQMERGHALVVLRSLLWPGLTFYHAPRTKNCGYIYVGTGEKNIDLPFML
ncbi:radial spoke head protein 9 homolog isoform 2-T2 [Hipposideros larvatus]